MTWSITARGTATSFKGSGNVVSDTFTPAANAIVCCFAFVPFTEADFTGGSGHGTMSSIFTGAVDPPGRMCFWACHVGASPSNAAISMTRAEQYQNATVFFEISHTDGVISPTASAFGTGDSDTFYNTDISLTLGSFAETDNLTLILSGKGGSSPSLTPDSPFAELFDFDGNSQVCAVHYRTSEDTTPTASVDSVFDDYYGYAVEIKHDSSGTIIPQAMHHYRQQD